MGVLTVPGPSTGGLRLKTSLLKYFAPESRTAQPSWLPLEVKQIENGLEAYPPAKPSIYNVTLNEHGFGMGKPERPLSHGPMPMPYGFEGRVCPMTTAVHAVAPAFERRRPLDPFGCRPSSFLFCAPMLKPGRERFGTGLAK